MVQCKVTPPPGKTDLEVLENLKEMIKNGQHDMYFPLPQPAFLAKLLLSPAMLRPSVSGSRSVGVQTLDAPLAGPNPTTCQDVINPGTAGMQPSENVSVSNTTSCPAVYDRVGTRTLPHQKNPSDDRTCRIPLEERIGRPTLQERLRDRDRENAPPSNRPFSPPSAADLARDRVRMMEFIPASPPPSRIGIDGYDDRSERVCRYHGSPYIGYYRPHRPQSRSPSPLWQRERYERDRNMPLPVHLRHWEPRDDEMREQGCLRRGSFSRGGSPLPFARAYNVPPPPQLKPLSARLTDGYLPIPEPVPSHSERPYAHRPMFLSNRVRLRSISPPLRIGWARPLKRAREDEYGGDFYPSPPSAGSGREGEPRLRGRSVECPSGGEASPPMTNLGVSGGGSIYFGRRDDAGGVDRERVRDNRPPQTRPIARERDYIPARFERPRSPPLRYVTPYVSRDERRYVPPASLPSMRL